MYPEITQFNDWLACQYSNSSTRKHYMSDLVLFFSWAKQPPKAITSYHVDEYIKHCLVQGLSPITINRRLSALRSFYYFLSILNEIPVHCPVIPKRHFLRKPQHLPRDSSEEQIELLFSHIHDPRDKAMFTLMLECGLRVGEVSDLLLENVLLDDLPELKVHGKGDKYRIVYLSPPAQKTLQSWLTHRPTVKSRAVFMNQRGERLSVSGIQYLLKGCCEKAGIQLTCHQLRHAFGRRMAEAKMPVTSLQKLLGHKDVRTTQGDFTSQYTATVSLHQGKYHQEAIFSKTQRNQLEWVPSGSSSMAGRADPCLLCKAFAGKRPYSAFPKSALSTVRFCTLGGRSSFHL
jgi:site-specific recombinase XerD